MKHVARTALLLILAVALVTSLNAEEKKKKERKKNDPTAQILKRLEKAELSEEQVAKIKELGAEFAPKLAAAQEAIGLTQEQKQARKQAIANNEAEGIKRKKAHKAIEAAMNLSEDQQAKLAEAKQLQTEFNDAVFALLTDTQREKTGKKAKKNQA